MNLQNLTIKKFHEGLINKQFSAFEITQEFFDYIEKKDSEIGAYLCLTKDLALSQANSVDSELAQGLSVGGQKKKIETLIGVPMAVKDNILIKGELTTAASKILKNYRASYDATVIGKLKNRGVIFLGKTNMDEFAMGSSTENSAFKITKNPFDLERVPGGSSGGSAAAVASGMAVAALGSDTGGSIRQPASFCGVVGLKPTYGAVSRNGLIAMASSLDQVGPITKTVEDADILFETIKGKDELDATSIELKSAICNLRFEDVRRLKIGLPKEYFSGGLDEETRRGAEEVVKVLKSLKIEFKEINLPHTKYALSSYYIIMPAEVSANLARFDGMRYARATSDMRQGKSLKDIYFKTRGEGFGEEVKKRIILGTFVLSSGYYDAYYAKAQKVRRLIREDFNKAFKDVDVILTPVAPTPAFKIGEKTSDPLQMYLSDIFTIPVNLAGLPAISIPVNSIKERESMTESNLKLLTAKRKLPVGFQLIGRHFCEKDILEMGKCYEKVINYE